jgi:C_GCAxxG_C_C family probable redox protein
MSEAERAVSCFKSGLVCSQAICSTYGPRLGLDVETALKISSSFGGGMGNTGGTCGAVTGAFMIIGLRSGRISVEDVDAKEENYELLRKFVREFKHRNGSIICRELLGHDISIPEELQLAREEKLFETLCPELVRDAAEIIEGMLWP